jgi:hypothetical protein
VGRPPRHYALISKQGSRSFARMGFRMNAFDLVGTSAPRPFPKWLPHVGGLLAAAFVASFVSHLPLVHTLSPGEILGLAFENVLEVFLASAAVAWGLCTIRPRPSGADTRRLILRTSLDALWLAPLALFIREDSLWAMPMAAVFVTRAVRSFRLLQDEPAPTDREESPLLFHRNALGPPQSSAFWQQASGAAATLCAEAGAIAALAGYSFTSAFLVGIASAVWTWSFTKGAQSDSGQPRSSYSRPLPLVVLAIVITAAGLIQYLPHSFRIRGFGVPSRYHARQGFPQGAQHVQPGREKTSEGSVMAAREGDPGIVLWPEKQTLTKLVAPAPVFGNGLLTNRSAKPLEIPFEGVYWFFKAPDVHPPRSSRQAHGSPEMLDIRSVDRRPLSMEAHEHLGNMLDLDCCSRIQIAIRNADHYPETVSLELVLINASVPGKPSQSLGTMMVKSTRPWKLYDEPAKPVSETLNFVIPAHASIRRFDEVMVVFRLDAARADAGPKIAIDRFVLVPRGL